MLGLNGKLLDFIYPVGSYYETSDTSFDPNVTWGGTWVKDSKGRVTVALDDSDADFNTISKTGGEKTHTLTIDEMPRHSHSISYIKSNATPLTEAGISGYNANNQGQGRTQVDNTGGGQAHNNVQPYVVVVRWHRTA